MTIWVWVISGIVGAILLSLILSLVIAKVLGIIADQISASTPLTQASDQETASGVRGQAQSTTATRRRIGLQTRLRR
jgi:hypothetical protein